MNAQYYHGASTAGNAAAKATRVKERVSGAMSELQGPPFFVVAPTVNTDMMILRKVEVLLHVAIWVTALVFEIMLWVDTDDIKKATTGSNGTGSNGTVVETVLGLALQGTPDTWPYATTSFVCFIVSVSVLVLSTVFSMANRELENNTVMPCVVATIRGGVRASVVVTFITLLLSDASMSSKTRANNITALVLKIMAATFFDTNVQLSFAAEQ